MFDPSQVYTSHGTLVLKLEPVDAKSEEYPYEHHGHAGVLYETDHMHSSTHHELGTNAIELPHVTDDPKIAQH